MTIKFSTCLANRIAGQAVTVTDAGSQIAFVNSTSRITTTQSDFLTKGFRPGQVIKVASSGSNDGLYTLTQVASDGSYMVTSESLADEAAGAATPTITAVNGFGWKAALNYGILVLFSSPMPATADEVETGTKLLEMTVNAGSFAAGTSTNGITFEFDSSGKIILATGITVQGVGITTGKAYYARYYDNGYITGDDSSNLYAPRFQGRVGTSGQDFTITSTDIVSGVTNTCDSINITQPKTA